MYAEVKNGNVTTWPYDYDTLCRKNPSTAFPTNTDLLSIYEGTQDNLDGNELVNVIEQDRPSYDPARQTIVQNSQPTLEGGQWSLGWTIVDLGTEDQQAAKMQQSAVVRQIRNSKLKECDWTQLSDSQVDKQTWAAYRQELRDIPGQEGFPWNAAWPNEPM
jgi:hypothetical protein